MDSLGETDRLWTELMAAKADGDLEQVRAIENRMRELAEERRFAHLSDAEIEARISGLLGNRQPEGLLAHSPGAVSDSVPGEGASTMAHNHRIRDNQAGVGVERTLTALREEQGRRRGGPPG